MSTSAITMARPYARAAFEAARDGGSLPAWGDSLAFAASVADDSRVRALIGNPRLGVDALKALLLPEGERADSTFANFIAMLADNRRLPLLPEIADVFGEMRREHEKVLRVVVRSAVAIDAAQTESLKTALKRRFNREIELATEIDPAVIGGAVIDAGETVIDGSVRGRLERLSQALTA
jgi:F-type H+-transporting ATPase subunit delta